MSDILPSHALPSHKCFGVLVPDLILFLSPYSLHVQAELNKNDVGNFPGKNDCGNFPGKKDGGNYPGKIYGGNFAGKIDDGNFSACIDTPTERIRALFLSKSHADITIIVRGKRDTFEVHKLILAMTSPVFEKMLSSKCNTITLDDDLEAIKWILLHTYTGYNEIPADVFDIIVLYKTLKKYAMDKTSASCVAALGNRISVENLNSIYTVATKLEEKFLITKCKEELNRSGEQVLALASKGLISSVLLLELLALENLRVPETVIFSAVVSWGKYQMKTVKETDLTTFLKPYLHEIDFLSMHPEEILTTVMSEDIFDSDEISGILMAMKNVSEDLVNSDKPIIASLREPVSYKRKIHSLYPSFLNTERRQRRFNCVKDIGQICSIFMNLECINVKNKNKFVFNGYLSMLTLQSSETVYLTRIRAHADCFQRENQLEIREHDLVLCHSSVNGPPWDFYPPVELKKKKSYSISISGKGKISSHKYKMFSIKHADTEFCGNCLHCDVSIRYIK